MAVQRQVHRSSGSAPATPLSLLRRLQQYQHPRDWDGFVTIYGPVVYGWGRRQRLQAHDAADLMQEVLVAVQRGLPRWRQEAEGPPFRAWLWTITKHKLHDLWRDQRRQVQGSGDSAIQALLEQLEAPGNPAERQWGESYQGEVLAGALRCVRPHFTERTWLAFQKTVMDEMPARAVAAELGMTLNAVFVAKCKVLGRLRHDLRGMLDNSVG